MSMQYHDVQNIFISIFVSVGCIALMLFTCWYIGCCPRFRDSKKKKQPPPMVDSKLAHWNPAFPEVEEVYRSESTSSEIMTGSVSSSRYYAGSTSGYPRGYIGSTSTTGYPSVGGGRGYPSVSGYPPGPPGRPMPPRGYVPQQLVYTAPPGGFPRQPGPYPGQPGGYPAAPGGGYPQGNVQFIAGGTTKGTISGQGAKGAF